MNYGNSNDIINKCPQCDNSIDKHKISLISSSEKTDKLARELQARLSKVNTRAVLKGLELDRTATMVGAAVVKFKDFSKTYVTVSGPGVALLGHIQSLGKDVVVITSATVLLAGNKVTNIQKKKFVPDVSKGKEYPVGSCAAQKLLTSIFADAKSLKSIVKVEMSEIMWRASGGKTSQSSRKWSTGSVVPSCKTCKQVVPQMLCNLTE